MIQHGCLTASPTQFCYSPQVCQFQRASIVIYCCPSSRMTLPFCLQCFPLVSRFTKKRRGGCRSAPHIACRCLFSRCCNASRSVFIKHTLNNHHPGALFASCHKATTTACDPQARHSAAIAATSPGSSIAPFFPFISAAHCRACVTFQQVYHYCLLTSYLCSCLPAFCHCLVCLLPTRQGQDSPLFFCAAARCFMIVTGSVMVKLFCLTLCNRSVTNRKKQNISSGYEVC